MVVCNHIVAMSTCVETLVFSVVRHIAVHHSPVIANLDEKMVLLITRGVNLLLTSIGVTIDMTMPQGESVLYEFMSSRTKSKYEQRYKLIMLVYICFCFLNNCSALLGVGDSGFITVAFCLAAVTFFLTNALQEVKGWSYDGWASIPKLVSQVLKIQDNSDPVQEGVSWSKKVGVALVIVGAILFALISRINLSELGRLAFITLPFWILGVILPLIGIVSNNNMLLFAKIQIRECAIMHIIRGSNSIQPIYPILE